METDKNFCRAPIFPSAGVFSPARIFRPAKIRAAAAIFIVFMLTKNALGAASNYFNYQGRLKQSGAAVSDFRYFEFRITDADGSTQYYTTGSTRIYVTNGLFRYNIGPVSGVDWGAVSVEPYLEVRVGQSSPDTTLLPRERLLSSPYAIFSSSAGYSLAAATSAFSVGATTAAYAANSSTATFSATASTAAYAANSAALNARAFDAFVSTRAENQTVGGVKTFAAPVVFQSSVSFSSATFAGQAVFQSTAVFSQVVAVGQNIITQSSITAPSLGVSTVTATGNISANTLSAGLFMSTMPAKGTIYLNNIVSGWVYFEIVGTAVTIHQSFNVDSVVRLNTGEYRVNWSRPFYNESYAMVVTASATDNDFRAQRHVTYAQTASSAFVATMYVLSSGYREAKFVSVMAIGNQ